MKTKLLAASIVLLLLLQFSSILHAYAQKQKANQTVWEYKIVYVNPTNTGNDSQEVLNRHGLEGWELTSFQYAGGSFIYCLKRPK